MIDSQEIIERSIYQSLLETTIRLGYTLNPEDYYPITPENLQRYQQDKAKIVATKGRFIPIFGVGNNQVKGMKDELPRIVVDSQGFLPGEIGLPRDMMEKVGQNFVVTEQPFEAIDQFIDIHLVSNTQEDIRLLLNIMVTSIPQRGYVKPYIYEDAPFDGNIFLEITNFYNTPNLDKGIIEKVYQFQVKDTLLDINFGSTEEPVVIPPLIDISVLIQGEFELNITKT